jgi:hypothetical protein
LAEAAAGVDQGSGKYALGARALFHVRRLISAAASTRRH